VRVLVTGSRGWADVAAVRAALDAATPAARITVVHGDCPTGADTHAHRWAADHDQRIETHFADWKAHGRAAGPIRNKAMVAAGADLCLAFIRNGSRGATGCAALAEAAGIPTRRWFA
jgi:hypothetical protein